MKRCLQNVWTCYWPTSLWWAWQPCNLPAFPAKQLKQFRGEGIVEDGVQADSPQAFNCSLWGLWGKSLNHAVHWVLKQQEISRQGEHHACQTFFAFCLYFFFFVTYFIVHEHESLMSHCQSFQRSFCVITRTWTRWGTGSKQPGGKELFLNP